MSTPQVGIFALGTGSYADGVRDALTRYTRALTGAYYFVPSQEAIRRFSTRSEDD